jgi:hypothetical protein
MDDDAEKMAEWLHKPTLTESQKRGLEQWFIRLKFGELPCPKTRLPNHAWGSATLRLGNPDFYERECSDCGAIKKESR